MAEVKDRESVETLKEGMAYALRKIEGLKADLKDVTERARTAEATLAEMQTHPAPDVLPEKTLSRGQIDGRKLRRTKRTMQFGTRVTPEFDDRIREIAQRDKILIVEVLEQALDQYVSNRSVS